MDIPPPRTLLDAVLEEEKATAVEALALRDWVYKAGAITDARTKVKNQEGWLLVARGELETLERSESELRAWLEANAPRLLENPFVAEHLRRTGDQAILAAKAPPTQEDDRT